MENMNNNYEKAFDLLLKEATSTVINEDGKKLILEKIENHDFSEKHNSEIRKILQKDRKTKLIRFVKNHKTLIASFIAIVVVLGVTLPNTKAIKLIFLNYFFDENSPYTSIRLDDGDATSYTNEYMTLQFIPGGYVKVHEDITNNGGTVFFENQDLWFSVYISKKSDEFRFDTEGAKVEEIIINNKKGLISVKENICIIVWNDEEMICGLAGNINKDVLIKIAENIIISK